MVQAQHAARVALALILAVVSPHGSQAIRHSQAYLARRAAANAAAHTNANYTQRLRAPRAPAQGAVQESARARANQARAASTRDTTQKNHKGGGGGSTGYPSSIISVFKQMRREEEEAADGSAPELPANIVTAWKSCSTRYGSMAYRTISKIPSPGEGNNTRAHLHAPADVVFIHGLGTDGTNCQPPAHVFDAEVDSNGDQYNNSRIKRRWLIPDLIGKTERERRERKE